VKANKKNNKCLDEALKSCDIKEYEDALELWKTYGGD